MNPTASYAKKARLTHSERNARGQHCCRDRRIFSTVHNGLQFEK
jgi:hypothetical protein